MRKRSILLTAAIAVAAALSTGHSTATAKPTATVSLSALFSSTHTVAWGVLIKNFNNVYPDIKIDPVTFLPSGTLRQVFLTEIQAGSAQDVFFINQGNSAPSAVWPMAASGHLLDLSSGKWAPRMNGFVRPDMSYKGKVYALPNAISLTGVFYNQDVFRQLGLQVPTTFPQLLTLCQKVKAAGKIPFAQGFAELTGFPNWVALLSAFPYIRQPNWGDLRSGHKVTFQSSASWREALQTLVDMKSAGCFSPGVSGTSVVQGETQLVKGDAVMSVLSSIQLGALLAINPNFHAGWFNFPGRTAAGTRINAAAPSAVAINAATKNAAAARTFVNFLGRPKQAALFAKVTGGIADYDFKKCVLPSFLASLENACKKKLVVASPTGEFANQNIALGYMSATALPGLVTGQRTVDDVLKALDYLWDNPNATSPPS